MRLIVLLVAAVFVWATALPGAAVSAAPMPQEKHCGDCPPAMPDLGKMMCGALACAGIVIGLPAQSASYVPMSSALVYSTRPALATAAAAPAPDPLPPRPTVPG